MLLNVTLFRDGYTFFNFNLLSKGKKTLIDLEEKTSCRRQFTVMAESEGHYTKTGICSDFFLKQKNVEECKGEAATVFRAPTHVSLQYISELGMVCQVDICKSDTLCKQQ